MECVGLVKERLLGLYGSTAVDDGEKLAVGCFLRVVEGFVRCAFRTGGLLLESALAALEEG